MGYYHIKLCPFSRKLCTIVLPWGKYEYQKLPMGLCNSVDIFQDKINELSNGLEYVRIYIGNKSFEDHINKLDKVLNELKQNVLKMQKSPFSPEMS